MDLRHIIEDWHKKTKARNRKKKNNYLHFDYNIAAEKALRKIINPNFVKIHAFLPLIHFQEVKRKYKKQPDKSRKIEKKSRDLYHASHMDSYIYLWYSLLLSKLYEDNLSSKPYNACVTAYRSLGKKSNIDFAKEVFNEIHKRKTCVAICIDLSKFFDTLDHKLLKIQWMNLLEDTILPNDHYAVYKSLVHFVFVDKADIDKYFLKGNKNNKMLRICSPLEFRKVRSMHKEIIKKNGNIGIPQGTPLSALLSNIYMSNFDRRVYHYVKRQRGFYRRYSDDLVIICDQEVYKKTFEYIKSQVKKMKLKINDDKTEYIFFEMRSNFIISRNEAGIKVNMQYLGFEFDGNSIFLRSSTLSKYYQRMHRTVKKFTNAAKKVKRGIVYKNTLYKKFTHLGKQNFNQYARFAYERTGSTNIRKQMKYHWRHLQKAIIKHMS